MTAWRDLLAEIGLSRLLHLAEDVGADLAWRIFLAAGLNPCVAVVALDDGVRHQALVLGDQRIVEAAADQALDGIEGVRRIGDGLALGGLSDEALPAVAEGDHAGGGACAFAILDHMDVAALHDRHARIGRAQVDSDDLAHTVVNSLAAAACGPKHRKLSLWNGMGCIVWAGLRQGEKGPVVRTACPV